MNVPNEINKAYRRPNSTKDVLIKFSNPSKTINKSDLSEFSFEESICSKNDLKFGLCEASKVKFTAKGLGNVDGQQISVKTKITETSTGNFMLRSTSKDVGKKSGKLEIREEYKVNGYLIIETDGKVKSAYFPEKSLSIDGKYMTGSYENTLTIRNDLYGFSEFSKLDIWFEDCSYLNVKDVTYNYSFYEIKDFTGVETKTYNAVADLSKQEIVICAKEAIKTAYNSNNLKLYRVDEDFDEETQEWGVTTKEYPYGAKVKEKNNVIVTSESSPTDKVSYIDVKSKENNKILVAVYDKNSAYVSERNYSLESFNSECVYYLNYNKGKGIKLKFYTDEGVINSLYVKFIGNDEEEQVITVNASEYTIDLWSMEAGIENVTVASKNTKVINLEVYKEKYSFGGEYEINLGDFVVESSKKQKGNLNVREVVAYSKAAKEDWKSNDVLREILGYSSVPRDFNFTLSPETIKKMRFPEMLKNGKLHNTDTTNDYHTGTISFYPYTVLNGPPVGADISFVDFYAQNECASKYIELSSGNYTDIRFKTLTVRVTYNDNSINAFSVDSIDMMKSKIKILNIQVIKSLAPSYFSFENAKSIVITNYSVDYNSASGSGGTIYVYGPKYEVEIVGKYANVSYGDLVYANAENYDAYESTMREIKTILGYYTETTCYPSVDYDYKNPFYYFYPRANFGVNSMHAIYSGDFQQNNIITDKSKLPYNDQNILPLESKRIDIPLKDEYEVIPLLGFKEKYEYAAAKEYVKDYFISDKVFRTITTSQNCAHKAVVEGYLWCPTKIRLYNLTDDTMQTFENTTKPKINYYCEKMESNTFDGITIKSEETKKIYNHVRNEVGKNNLKGYGNGIDLKTYNFPRSVKGIIEGSLELNGLFGLFGRDGAFHEISLSKEMIYPSDNLYPDGTLYPAGDIDISCETIEKAYYRNFYYEDYPTKKYKAISASYTNENGEEAETTYTFVRADQVTNIDDYQTYYMTDNYILKNGNYSRDKVRYLLENMADKIKDIQYTKLDFECFGLPYVEAGDYITVLDGDKSVGSYVLSRKLDGINTLTDSIKSI